MTGGARPPPAPVAGATARLRWIRRGRLARIRARLRDRRARSLLFRIHLRGLARELGLGPVDLAYALLAEFNLLLPAARLAPVQRLLPVAASPP